ncbi:MAG: DUF6268 family outer membrane beta-barrel protein, partial [bacterium]|nr:DUF6268 family outer membrane beta-barrel protein [bacterium]MDI1337454.1 DUF6268 family outer membrane beta-barrel protein [Lacunisphaera sp.]
MKTLLLLPALLAVTALAQPSATMRPALLSSLDVEISSSSKENLERGGTGYGTVSVLSTSLSVSGRHSLDASTMFIYGLAYERHDLDATTGLLPGKLAELSVNLGLQRRFSATWSGAVFARPGFYSDFEHLTSRSLNLPVLAMLNYTQSSTLTWNFGLNLNAFSDHPVLPIAGVRWQFAPDWTFSIGFPQSGFSWRTGDWLTLRAGVGFTGGSFRVTENRGVPAPGIARLADTYLDFREVRAGLGADFNLSSGFKLAVDLGAVTDRKFDYFDRDFRLDGDTGLYGTVALRASF